MDPGMQIGEPGLDIRSIGRPCHAVRARRSVPLQCEERLPEKIDIDMVQERSELPLLVQPCGFPYAVEPR
jgi:hypothetical protein